MHSSQACAEMNFDLKENIHGAYGALWLVLNSRNISAVLPTNMMAKAGIAFIALGNDRTTRVTFPTIFLVSRLIEVLLGKGLSYWHWHFYHPSRWDLEGKFVVSGVGREKWRRLLLTPANLCAVRHFDRNGCEVPAKKLCFVLSDTQKWQRNPQRQTCSATVLS